MTTERESAEVAKAYIENSVPTWAHDDQVERDEALAALDSLITRLSRLEEALERGLDWMDVQHFPWCALEDIAGALARNEPGCDCGRTALDSETKER